MSPLTRCAPPTQSEAGGHSMGEVAGWTFFVAVSNIFWYISLSGCETGAAVFITLAARRQWATKRGICHSRRVKSIQQSGCMLPASLVTQPSSSLSSCVYFQKIWLVWKDHRKKLPWTWRAEVFYFDGVKIRLRRGCRGLGGLLLVSAAAFTGSFRLQICCTWWVVLQSDVKRVHEHVRRTEAKKTAAKGVSLFNYVK